MLKNDLMLRTLRGEKTEQTPVWLMRQAGRYLPEYRELRKKAGSFMNLATHPEYACEITLQPLRRFPLDAAIIFSDILTIPDAMGLGLHFEEGVGPKFERPLSQEKDFLSLTKPDVEDDLGYVMDAIRLTRKELDGKVPLIGFCGSPFTLACYMIDGGGSKHFIKTKQLIYNRPDLMHHLLKVLSDALIDYLTAQVKAGAQILQIFDTWGGILTTPAFANFSLSYTEKIVEALKKAPETSEVPVIAFTKEAPLAWYKMYENIQVDCVGIDWRHELDLVSNSIRNIAIQGNLDPLSLIGSDEHIVSTIHQILKSVSKDTPHIFNLGHGMDKSIHPDKVALLVDTVHSYSRELKK